MKLTKAAWSGAFAVSVALFLGGLSLEAHHSFAAQYDSNEPITVEGQITEVQWRNPHIYLFVDVEDESGAVENWAIEGGTPNNLFRRGWRKDDLKIGDSVRVEGFRARDGSNLINGRNVTMPDGRRVYGGSANDGGPAGPRGNN